MNHTPLRAYDRLVTTPFGLLGTDENALSFALGYIFQQCSPLLQWFLRTIGNAGLHRSALQRARIDLHQYRSGEGCPLRKALTNLLLTSSQSPGEAQQGTNPAAGHQRACSCR